MTLIDSLTRAGVDIETTLHRFAENWSLWERFIFQFPADATYSRLTDAVSKKQYDQAEQFAHTLKGTAANLGYQELSDRCSALVTDLRNGRYGEAEQRMEEISNTYRKIMELISLIGMKED